MPEKFRRAVFAVTYAKTDKGIMYLLLKRKFHWRGWEFIKGGIDRGESKNSAVKREVFEETGNRPVKVTRFGFFGRYRYKRTLPDRKGLQGQSYSLYGAEIKFGNVKIDVKEHSGYEWLPFNEAVKRLTFKNQKKCLRIVDDWLGKNEKNKIQGN